MFCEKCGTQIPEGEKKCPNCGSNNGINSEEMLKAVSKKSQELMSNAKKMTEEVVDNIQSGEIQKNIQNKSFNVVALVGAIVAFIGVLLPMYKIAAFGFSQSINLFAMEKAFSALLLMGIAAIGAIGAILKKTNLTMVAGIALVAIVFIIYFSVKSELGMASSLVKTTIGFYSMLIGGIVMIVSHFVSQK